jgi:hypothetical protein
VVVAMDETFFGDFLILVLDEAAIAEKSPGTD